MSVKICVPITGKNEKEILQQAERIRKSKNFKDISVVEFRYDLAKEISKEQLLELLKGIRSKIEEKSLLFTIRTKVQGGEFSADFSSYESINCAAIESGFIDMVDIELRREGYLKGLPTRRDLESAARIIREARAQAVKTIASYHDFQKTPSEEGLHEIFTELKESDADILKAAFMPNCEEDVLRLLLETRRFREQDQNKHEYITMSMGKLGALSRIAGELSGSDYSFMAVGETSAPGQLPLADGVRMLQQLF